MIILGIETSCDETACAILKKQGNRITILSNIVASSAKLQTKYGGIIPEQAAREQIKSIIPVIEEALEQAQSTRGVKSTNPAGFIDAIAVTYGPGLIGSLLVGVETAKTLAKIWQKPLIPVNHLIGHFYANWIEDKWTMENGKWKKKSKKAFSIVNSQLSIPSFPCLGLLVSGGHTDLVLFEDHGKYTYLGGTRDDAAGECFDKCARLLGLSYPGGPQISKLAQKGNPKAFDLPRPMINSKNYDFSFSGLKTAVANLLHTPPVILNEVKNISFADAQDDKTLADLAASIETAIVDVLVAKTLRAVKEYRVKQVIVAGGVAANQHLVNRLQVTVNSLNVNLCIPPPELCTDNGAMIAAAGFFIKPLKNPLDLQADPNLALFH